MTKSWRPRLLSADNNFLTGTIYVRLNRRHLRLLSADNKETEGDVQRSPALRVVGGISRNHREAGA